MITPTQNELELDDFWGHFQPKPFYDSNETLSKCQCPGPEDKEKQEASKPTENYSLVFWGLLYAHLLVPQ